jgi:hypothetical protein
MAGRLPACEAQRSGELVEERADFIDEYSRIALSGLEALWGGKMPRHPLPHLHT